MLVLLQAAYNFAIAVRIRWYLQNLMLIVNAKYSTRTLGVTFELAAAKLEH